MSEQRPTLRPVTLGRLVEVVHLCEDEGQTSDEVAKRLEVTHRRARETILEAERLDFLTQVTGDDTSEDEAKFLTSSVGEGFLSAVRNEAWLSVSTILEQRSPHYVAFLSILREIEEATQDRILAELEDHSESTQFDYNQTSVDVLADWAERLGIVQKNAFSGRYYLVEQPEAPLNFPEHLLSIYNELEETAGVDLRQRHLSIPELREHLCERLGCPRNVFDEVLQKLAQENVGKLELSGAPLDTAAKQSPEGIRQITLDEGPSLVSTSQTTDRVMAGIELYGKTYYYLAIYDRDLSFSQETNNEH